MGTRNEVTGRISGATVRITAMELFPGGTSPFFRMQVFYNPMPFRFSFLAVAFFMATVTHVRADEENDEILGKAGAFEVKLSEVRKNLDVLGEAERAALLREPAALNQYVRALLVQQVVLSEAQKVGWEKSAVVAERMSTLRDGVVASTFIESVSTPMAAYPSETELAETYAANRESFLQPKAWRLSQIFISAPREAGSTEDPPEVLARLKSVTADLKAGTADFETLAETRSEEPASAARRGEIGWLPEPQIHPAIRAILPEMGLAAISEPVRMDDGWHFIKVLDIREPRIPTLEQVRELLVKQMRAERAKAETESFLGGLLTENPIAINELVLGRLLSGSTN